MVVILCGVFFRTEPAAGQFGGALHTERVRHPY
jgi:hypothetical protein